MTYAMIIDILLILIALFSVYKGFKTGFLSSVIFVVGSLLSIFSAIKFSAYIGEFIFNEFIREGLIEKVASMTNLDSISNISIQSEILKLIDNIPNGIQKSLEMVMGNLNNYVTQIQQNSGNIIENIPVSIVDTVFAPVILMLLNLILSLILFVVFAIIVRAISRLFKNFYRVPILGGINSLLGGLVGIIQAAVSFYILAIICRIFIIVTSDQLSFLNESIINSTSIMKYIYNFVDL